MVSEEPTRKIVKELSDAGWSWKRAAKGSHSIYGCGCGKHQISVPDGHRNTSAGMVRKIRAAITQCK